MIGVPIVPTISRTGWGIHNLFDTIIRVYEREDPVVRHIHINHGQIIERWHYCCQRCHQERGAIGLFTPPLDIWAIKLLERDKEIEQLLSKEPQYAQWIELRE